MTVRMNYSHDIPIKQHDICKTGGGKFFNDINIGQLKKISFNFFMLFM